LSYVDKVLQPGESVRYRSTIHWVIYLPSILLGLIGCVGIGLLLTEHNDRVPPLALMGIGFGLGFLTFMSAWFRRWTTEIAVTDLRIIYKVGFISRHTIEMNMHKVESVDVEQSMFGRLLDYGDIVVRGTGAGLEPLRKIDSPLQFRNMIIAR